MSVSLRRVLCAIDFSACSSRALHAAEAFAMRYNAQLIVLHVHQRATPLVGAGPFVAGELFDPSFASADHGQLAAALRSLVTQETALDHADAMVEEASDVANAILARAAALHADVVVLGTHGRSGIQHFLMGSVAETVLRRAGCAVLTVPLTAAHDGSVLFRRILCALDFSTGSALALRHARDLAAAAAAQLTILHVIELPPAGPELSQADLARCRAARFDYARGCMKASLANVRGTCDVSELLLVGQPEREILRVATEQESDLIVMGVHGRRAVDLAMFGSVTHHVLRHSPCLVLTVRADQT